MSLTSSSSVPREVNLVNKRALKEFAVFARNELRNQVENRAKVFGVTAEGFGQYFVGHDYVELNNQRYPITMRPVFDKLLREYKQKGYDQLIEEVAYTWFNRIIAIRYMELHDYLPNRIRVLSSETPGKVDPDILTEYQNVDLPINKDEITALLNSGKREEAYRKLFIAQCRQLHELMPFLFEQVDDYTELLLPEHLLHTESVIYKLVHDEGLTESFQEVEVIGWLYQYYMSQKKEEVGGLKNRAISKEHLPIVTQLYTPKWIVQYMTQNSLGKLYHQLNPETRLIEKWEYYLKDRDIERPKPNELSLEKIKILDPACGSGHILVYAFELLFDMYEEAGYPLREIPFLILKNNLYGLDIDKRAVQLASFALMMKAQEKYQRFLKKANEIKLNVYEYIDAEIIDEEALNYLCWSEEEKNEIKHLINQFSNAKEYGSLIQPLQIDYQTYMQRIEHLQNDVDDIVGKSYLSILQEKLLPILKIAKVISEKYEVVITNPPYHNKYTPALKKFLETMYPDYKADLYSAFIYRCTQMTVKNGYAALMTPFTWMFISTHEKLRRYIIDNQSISSLVQLEYSAFKDATVPICTFVIQNQDQTPVGEYIRLSDFRGEEIQPIKVQEAVKNPSVSYRYQANSKWFKEIPGSPIAYWVTDHVRNIFNKHPMLKEYAEPKVGLQTGDNAKFLRFWHEVSLSKIGFGLKSRKEAQESKKRWFPYNKGGEYRKWYGNQEYIVNWENDGYVIRNLYDQNGKLRSRPQNTEYYFKECITWSKITSSKISFRYIPNGFIFDVAGCSVFGLNQNSYYVLGLLNSQIINYIIKVFSETLNFEVGTIKSIPIIFTKDQLTKENINNLVKNNILISKQDWDSFETSWDFKRHPFLTYKGNSKTLAEAYANWVEHTEKQFRQLQANEEELNRIFIEMYGLQDELTPEVPDEEVTVRRADRERDAKSFLSYFIGCVMGRYSLDVEGLVYAGGTWDESKYITFKPDKDGIIPLTDAAYFEDDIITRLQEYLAVTFGKETVQENMQWLAESLGMKQNETAMGRLRRYFFDDFYQDHFAVYKKRPIYWMVDSGKQKGFRALIYLHRYSSEMLATLRFDYLQELQIKIDQEIKRLEQVLINPDLSKTEQRRLKKQIETLKLRQEEMIEFDKTLAEVVNQRIELDLDDGVKINYNKLKPILAKVDL